MWIDEGPAIRAYFIFLQKLMKRYLDITLIIALAFNIARHCSCSIIEGK